jgi:hypothetical protein
MTTSAARTLCLQDLMTCLFCMQGLSSALKLSMQRLDALPAVGSVSVPMPAQNKSTVYPEPNTALVQASQTVKLYSSSGCQELPCILSQATGAKLVLDFTAGYGKRLLDNVASSSWLVPFFNGGSTSSPYARWLRDLDSAVAGRAVNPRADWIRVVAMGAGDLAATGHNNSRECLGADGGPGCPCALRSADPHQPYAHQVPVLILDVHFESGTPAAVIEAAQQIFDSGFPDAWHLGSSVCMASLGSDVSVHTEPCEDGTLPRYRPRAPLAPPDQPAYAEPPPMMHEEHPAFEYDGPPPLGDDGVKPPPSTEYDGPTPLDEDDMQPPPGWATDGGSNNPPADSMMVRKPPPVSDDEAQPPPWDDEFTAQPPPLGEDSAQPPGLEDDGSLQPPGDDWVAMQPPPRDFSGSDVPPPGYGDPGFDEKGETDNMPPPFPGAADDAGSIVFEVLHPHTCASSYTLVCYVPSLGSHVQERA